jgi:hypothetical protein
VSALRDAIRRASGWLTGDEIIGCIDAYNAGAKAAQEQGLDEMPICFEVNGRKIQILIDKNAGPDAILAIQAIIEAAKTELDPE